MADFSILIYIIEADGFPAIDRHRLWENQMPMEKDHGAIRKLRVHSEMVGWQGQQQQQ